MCNNFGETLIEVVEYRQQMNMEEELRRIATNDQLLKSVHDLAVFIWHYRDGLVEGGATEDLANIFALQMQQLLLDKMINAGHS